MLLNRGYIGSLLTAFSSCLWRFSEAASAAGLLISASFQLHGSKRSPDERTSSTSSCYLTHIIEHDDHLPEMLATVYPFRRCCLGCC